MYVSHFKVICNVTDRVANKIFSLQNINKVFTSNNYKSHVSTLTEIPNKNYISSARVVFPPFVDFSHWGYQFQRNSKGRTTRKLMGGAGEVQKKYSRKEKINEKNSCTPINPKKYSCNGLKKIHTRNVITKNNSCGSKISHPHPPHKFSNGPSLSFCINFYPIGVLPHFIIGKQLNQKHAITNSAISLANVLTIYCIITSE